VVDGRIQRLTNRSGQSATASSGGAGQGSPAGSEQLELLQNIRSGLIDWTEKQLAGTTDAALQHRALDLLARQIYDYRTDASYRQELTDEFEQVARQLQGLKSDYRSANRRVTEINRTISELKGQRRQLEQVDADQQAANRESIAGINQQIQEQTRLSEASTATAQSQNQRIQTLENREEFLRLLNHDGEALQLNRHYPVRLPIVVPGGGTWANLYYLLTSIHAFHLIVGLLVFTCVMMSRAIRSETIVHNAVLYWHFVDVVWLILFAVIYI